MAEEANIHTNGSRDKQIMRVIDEERNQDNCKNRADWLAQVKKRFQPGYTMRIVSPFVSIYRAPKQMLFLNPQCYLPRIVSLGPYQCQMNPKLSLMEEYKLEAVHRTLKRLNGITVDGLIAYVGQWENEIRDFYEEVIDCDKETLAWMLTMDACFILESLIAYTTGIRSDIQQFSLIFRSSEDQNGLMYQIHLDILMLENQIPLFILKVILQLESQNPNVVLKFLVRPLIFTGVPFGESARNLREGLIENASHLLDLVQWTNGCFLLDCFRARSGENSRSLRCSPLSLNNPEMKWGSMVYNPSAEALQKVGIKIKSSHTGNIYFEKKGFGHSSTLFLPEISIGDSTETVLRNLMAFEDCQRNRRMPVITRFIIFLAFLITTPKDVALLREGNVIKSPIGSDEKLAAMFKNLCQGTIASRVPDFDDVLKEVQDHYNSRVNLWINQFKEEYCSKPWYLISLACAVLLLGMTIVQTFYSVK